MSDATTPVNIDLKKNERLEIHWQDGKVCQYSISLLRTMCPCAQCRTVREGDQKETRKKTSLTILPGNFSAPLAAAGASLVGNYALKLEWSDGHSAGIYSFEYLRSICPA